MNRRQKGGQTTIEGEGGVRRERRSEPPSYGEVEGIHQNVLSFHSKKAIQRRQRKEAPPRGGEGRQHHQKEGRDRSHWERSTTAQTKEKEGREKCTSPFLWCSLPPPPLGGAGSRKNGTSPQRAEVKAPLPEGGEGQAAAPTRREVKSSSTPRMGRKAASSKKARKKATPPKVGSGDFLPPPFGRCCFPQPFI